METLIHLNGVTGKNSRKWVCKIGIIFCELCDSEVFNTIKEDPQDAFAELGPKLTCLTFSCRLFGDSFGKHRGTLMHMGMFHYICAFV